MTIQRMDNVLIVVDDLDAVIAFFVELGMELEGKGTRFELGHRLVDRYLAFVAGRVRPNTVRAAAFDLKRSSQSLARTRSR